MKLLVPLVAVIGSACLSAAALNVGSINAQTLPPVVFPRSLRPPIAPDLTIAQLRQLTQATAVKVLVDRSWGSGILLQRQGNLYTVVTNDHVLGLASGSTSYRLQTADGRIYNAARVNGRSAGGADLALLQFRSTNASYPLATISQTAPLAIGEPVFAVGFPFDADRAIPKGFIFTAGTIAFVTEKALNGGYRIGYTNAVEKGMSGGALLNRQGQVVGINGMHAYPLWGDPYVFQDGSKPNLPQMLMVRSSWAIPIATLQPLLNADRSLPTIVPHRVRDPLLLLPRSTSDRSSPPVPTQPSPAPGLLW